MRKRKAQPLQDILKELLSEQHLDLHLNEMEVVRIWPEVVGPAVNNYTTNLYVRNRTLYVQLSSSVLRGELLMYRQQLIQKLNAKIGDAVICQIIFQ